MENNKKIIDLKLSTQRALLGMIYPEIRAIAIGFLNGKKIKIIMYLDKTPEEFDNENLKEITSEILSDIPEIEEFDEQCVYSNEIINKLDCLDFLAYARKE